jgi:ribosomal protein S18 acetylase RimI-like enzyme
MRAGEEKLLVEALGLQPLMNVMLIGLLRDHGIESPRHRGHFYGCFADGRLTGVALIGHHVLLGGSPESVEFFARVARLRHASEVEVVLAEATFAARFCSSFEGPPGERIGRQHIDHQLLSLTCVEGRAAETLKLRKARPDETDEIARLNTDAFVELYGLNPSAQDPEGFRRRILNRVKMGRIWVLTDTAGIVFKAEVVCPTADAVYLEGIITRPDARGAGLGRRAFQSLCRRLLRRHRAVCLLADVGNQRAISFYQTIGFEPVAAYKLIRY